MTTRPRDQHCANCDLAEFAAVTYESTHPKREDCHQCDGEGLIGVNNCPRCGGSGTEPPPKPALPSPAAAPPQQEGELREALRKLMKESAAVVALAEPALRDEIGHTNLAVFKLRINEAGSALSASPSPSAGWQLQDLASAMKKMLPPALLAEVVAHLDPLTPFLAALREDDKPLPAPPSQGAAR